MVVSDLTLVFTVTSMLHHFLWDSGPENQTINQSNKKTDVPNKSVRVPWDFGKQQYKYSFIGSLEARCSERSYLGIAPYLRQKLSAFSGLLFLCHLLDNFS